MSSKLTKMSPQKLKIGTKKSQEAFSLSGFIRLCNAVTVIDQFGFVHLRKAFFSFLSGESLNNLAARNSKLWAAGERIERNARMQITMAQPIFVSKHSKETCFTVLAISWFLDATCYLSGSWNDIRPFSGWKWMHVQEGEALKNGPIMHELFSARFALGMKRGE